MHVERCGNKAEFLLLRTFEGQTISHLLNSATFSTFFIHYCKAKYTQVSKNEHLKRIIALRLSSHQPLASIEDAANDFPNSTFFSICKIFVFVYKLSFFRFVYRSCRILFFFCHYSILFIKCFSDFVPFVCN